MSQQHPFIGIFFNLGLIHGKLDPEISLRSDAFLNGVNTNPQTGAYDPVPGLQVETRYGDADFASYLAIAQDLASSTRDGQPPDLYFTTCWPSLRALKAQPPNGLGIVVPIVIAGLPEIAPDWGTLTTNATNVYGFFTAGTNICTEWLKLLLLINANIKRVGVVFDDDNGDRKDAQYIYTTVAQLLKNEEITPVKINCGSPTLEDDIKQFKTDSGTTPAGLIVAMSALTAKRRLEVFDAVKTSKLPAVYPNRLYTHGGDSVSAGGASRGTNLLDLYNKAGGYARRTIDVNIRQVAGVTLPSPRINNDQTDPFKAKFETVINSQSLADIGITVTRQVLQNADLVVY